MATETLAPPNPDSLQAATPPPGRNSDRVFRVVTLAAGLLVLVVLAFIVVATASQAQTWFSKEGFGAIFSANWDPAHQHFGALPLLCGTLLVAFLALLIAVPVSIGI